MHIINNYSLQGITTFKTPVRTTYYADIGSEDEIYQLIKNDLIDKTKVLVLGRGANVLFTKDWDGIVLTMNIKGKKILEENEENVLLEVGGGEDWHEFVTYCVDNNYCGVENMAMIPGTMGAAPVQNIAAYGQNFQDIFVSLDAIHILTGEKKTFYKKECNFTYRSSYFKNLFPNTWIVTMVRVQLSKIPDINTSYFETGKTYAEKVSIEKELGTFAKRPYTIRNIFDAVCAIRKKKLPDITKVGSAGCFFKNPVIPKTRYEELLSLDPDLQCYPVDELTYPKLDDPCLTHADYVKIPAGRLIDNLGWKGKRVGDVGVHENHALIIVNYGVATGKEVLDLAEAIKDDVWEKYKIELESEVLII